MRRLYRVRGLDCAHEAALLRDALQGLDGVAAVSFDVVRGRMAVTGPAAPEAVAAAVAGTGLAAEPWTDARQERSLVAFSTALSGASALAGLLSAAFGGPVVPFQAVAVAAGLWHVLPKALLAARHRRPDMHLLMTVAVAGAMGIGEWIEAGTVAFLYSLALALEAWSVDRARRAVEALLELAPAEATLLEDGGERRVAAEEVAVGSRVLVRPGERVPLDGVVVDGESALDQSAITGESLPVDRGAGDAVYAGSINGPGALVVETTKEAGETTVAHMVRLVEEAGERRSRSERWVDRFARVYTPAVMGAALLVLLVPPLLFAAPWEAWIYRSLVLLVIACPCALVISTPVSMVAGLTAAARHGVLVKGGEHLERAARLETVAFDKTGTLTHGRPRVVEVVAYAGHDEGEVLSRAAAVEARAEHPVARAVLAAAAERGLAVPEAKGVKAHGGKGVEGTVNGRRYWVGSHRWLDELREEEARVRDRMAELAGPGRSVLFVGSEDHVCGLIALEDELRPEARAQLEALRRAGVAHVAMLTGDNRPTADAIGRAAGVDEVRAELLPEQKVAAVAELPGPVAMVGDGVNDAAAMARADLGIAMGAIGSDAAVETADVALMHDDLSRLPWLIGHARRTLRIIRQNVAASLAIKAVFVALTLFGPVTLWAAIAADMGVSLAVVFNALRLLDG